MKACEKTKKKSRVHLGEKSRVLSLKFEKSRVNFSRGGKKRSCTFLDLHTYACPHIAQILSGLEFAYNQIRPGLVVLPP